MAAARPWVRFYGEVLQVASTTSSPCQHTRRGGAAHLRRREAADSESLTAQELQIAQLVARGHTNREVGAALFLSPKTIESHLGHVYRKLNLRSRTELAALLAGQDAITST